MQIKGLISMWEPAQLNTKGPKGFHTSRRSALPDLVMWGLLGEEECLDLLHIRHTANYLVSYS